MSDAEFESAIKQAFSVARLVTPVKTRNLYQSIGISRVSDGVWEVYVDEKQAPYMKYTNESWDNFKAPLHGKNNPNERWWDDKFVPIFMRNLASLTGAEID